jgi:sialic acid synthase SpsE
MRLLEDAFSLTTGYSDHTLGIEVALIALGLGARMIEKHFTLDKSRTSFRDHALSADPADIRRLAAAVRAYGEILGDGRKDEQIADRSMAAAVRRSIVAARDLPSGTVLGAGDLDYVRPGAGIAPSDAALVQGKTLIRALQRHAVIDLKDLA